MQEIVTIVAVMSRSDPELNWNKFYNFFRILSISDKLMVSYFFQHKTKEINEICGFWPFSSKNGCQNIVLGSRGTHFMHTKVNKVTFVMDMTITQVLLQ